MIRDNLAMDFQPNSIYAASKKLKTIALKGLENLKDDADMATRNALLSSADMKVKISEFLNGIDIIINTIRYLNGYVDDFIKQVKRSPEYQNDPIGFESTYGHYFDKTNYYPSLNTAYPDLMGNFVKQPEHTVGSGRKKNRVSRLFGGAGSSKASSVTGSVATGSDLTSVDDEEFEAALDSVRQQERPIPKILNLLISQVNKTNFFFNARIKPNLSQLTSSDSNSISAAMSKMANAFKTMKVEFINLSSEDAGAMVAALFDNVNKLRTDVDIALKTFGGLQEGQYSGSGMVHCSGGSMGHIIAPVFIPYARKYQNFDAKYLL
jgi:hypothetical protein